MRSPNDSDIGDVRLAQAWVSISDPIIALAVLIILAAAWVYSNCWRASTIAGNISVALVAEATVAAAVFMALVAWLMTMLAP